MSHDTGAEFGPPPKRSLIEIAAGYAGTACMGIQALALKAQQGRQEDPNARYGSPEARRRAYGTLLSATVGQFIRASAQHPDLIFPVRYKFAPDGAYNNRLIFTPLQADGRPGLVLLRQRTPFNVKFPPEYHVEMFLAQEANGNRRGIDFVLPDAVPYPRFLSPRMVTRIGDHLLEKLVNDPTDGTFPACSVIDYGPAPSPVFSATYMEVIAEELSALDPVDPRKMTPELSAIGAPDRIMDIDT